MARPSKGEAKRKQYNASLEPYKIEVIGGSKMCNTIAYNYLTKLAKKLINEK